MARSGGLGGILGAAGIGATAGMIGQEFSQTAGEINDLAKRARALGMLSDELDALEYAASKNSVTEDQLAVSLKTLDKQMAATARGTGEGRAAFEALGVKVTDSQGRMKSATSVMAEVAEGLTHIESAEQRAAYAQNIFGESGVGMINMLGNGAEGFRQAVAEGYALGVRYEDLTLKGEKYHDAQLQLNRSVRNIKDVIVGSALPGLTVLTEVMSGSMLRAVTGLDDEFRKFMGSLHTLPAETALDEMVRKEAELLAAISASNAEMALRDEAARKAPHSTAREAKEIYINTPANKAARIARNENEQQRRQLAALRSEMERLRAQVKRAADEEEAWKRRLGDSTGAAASASSANGELANSHRSVADATDRMNDAQRRALHIITDLWSPEQKFNYELAENLALVRAGYLTWSQYFAWFQRARSEMTHVSKDVQSATTDIDAAAVAAGDSLSRIQEVGVEATRGISDGFSRMVRGQMRSLEDLADFAADIFGRIADQILQVYVVNGITDAIRGGTSRAHGGTQSGRVTGSGLSGVSEKAALAAPAVNFFISAADGPSVAHMLRKQEPLIVGMVQKAYNRAGRRGPNG